MKSIVTTVLVLVIAALTGCANVPMTAQNGNPNVYAPRQAMAAGRVIDGIVTQVRIVTIESTNNAKLAGGALGGIVGNLLARNANNTARTGATLISGVLGAVAGHQLGKTDAEEVVVQMADGYRRVFVQEPGAAPRRVGQRVLVLVNGDEARIVDRM